MGEVTRVRFEAEGCEHADVLRALDAATALLRPAEAMHSTATYSSDGGYEVGGSVSNIAIGGLRDEFGQVPDTEFVEEVIESKIREDGAIYYVGRRVLKIVPRQPLSVAYEYGAARVGGVESGETPDFDPITCCIYSPPRDLRIGDGVGITVYVSGHPTNVWMAPDATVRATVKAAAVVQGYGDIDLSRWDVKSSDGSAVDPDAPVVGSTRIGEFLSLETVGARGWALS